MRITEAGYSAMMYETERLRECARKVGPRLAQLMKQTGATAVAVTGKSGMSMAFATLMLYDFPLIVVRKPHELSHGSPIEGTIQTVSKYLILDDFVASGDTVRAIIERIAEYAEIRDETVPKCGGVLQYQYTDPQDSGFILHLDYDVPMYCMLP